MIKTLIRCVIFIYKKKIYIKVLWICVIGSSSLWHSIIGNITLNYKYRFGAKLNKYSIIINFATIYEDEILQMDDEVFTQCMRIIKSMRVYLIFHLNIFGRRMFYYFPLIDNEFRRVLKWCRVKYANNNITDAYLSYNFLPKIQSLS